MRFYTIGRAAAATSVALLVACSDGMGPGDGPLRITGNDAPALRHGAENGEWRVECDLELVAALASGSSGPATWKGGSLRWRQAYTGAPLAWNQR